MRLAHVHVLKPITYASALKRQEHLLNAQFQYKTALREARHAGHKLNQEEPNPTLLTFQTDPTYTVGRRHLTSNPLSDEQISFLTGQSNSLKEDDTLYKNDDRRQLATFFASPRGGLLTYHAPGQLTAFLILNLRSHSLTPRCYIRLLEDVVIKTCATCGVPNTMTTDDPGVWISTIDSQGEQVPTDRKVCAVGVHISQGITSHGLGFNVLDQPIDVTHHSAHQYTGLPQHSSSYTTPSTSNGLLASGYLSWGFSRIVACGLEGKTVTWLAKEQPPQYLEQKGVVTPTVQNVANNLAATIAKRLQLEVCDSVRD